MAFCFKALCGKLTQRRKNYEYDVLKVAKFLSSMKSGLNEILKISIVLSGEK